MAISIHYDAEKVRKELPVAVASLTPQEAGFHLATMSTLVYLRGFRKEIVDFFSDGLQNASSERSFFDEGKTRLEVLLNSQGKVSLVTGVLGRGNSAMLYAPTTKIFGLAHYLYAHLPDLTAEELQISEEVIEGMNLVTKTIAGYSQDYKYALQLLRERCPSAPQTGKLFPAIDLKELIGIKLGLRQEYQKQQH